MSRSNCSTKAVLRKFNYKLTTAYLINYKLNGAKGLLTKICQKNKFGYKIKKSFWEVMRKISVKDQYKNKKKQKTRNIFLLPISYNNKKKITI